MLKSARISSAASQGQQFCPRTSHAESSRDLLASGKKKLYAEKNAEAALKDFQSSLQKSPQFYEAHYQAGMAYLFLQSPAEAEKSFASPWTSAKNNIRTRTSPSHNLA